MSILIKGMEMPTNCGDCYFEQIGAEEDDYGDTFCISYCLLTEWRIALSNRDDMKLPSCPLVEIPTPHGRLIDKDELLKFFMDYAWDWSSVDGITTTAALKQVISDVKNAPTILEAEE